MEVRHINRSSPATHHPKVYTGAKSEFESVIMRRVVRPYYSNRTATVQQPRCGSIRALTAVPSPWARHLERVLTSVWTGS